MKKDVFFDASALSTRPFYIQSNRRHSRRRIHSHRNGRLPHRHNLAHSRIHTHRCRHRRCLTTENSRRHPPSTVNATTTTVTIATSTQAPAAPTVSSTVRHHKTFLCLFFKFNVLHNKVKIKNPQPQCVPHRTKPAANILITNKTICRRRLDIAYY